ncbi:hypothetical protein GCM10009740_02320 [Terrabacter terrae]|uniref:Uncharacterized protein n=1 Tax=Terrabacter terrae TaxID=318434 RepID=A0ABN2TSP9_9MICO
MSKARESALMTPSTADPQWERKAKLALRAREAAAKSRRNKSASFRKGVGHSASIAIPR